MGFGYATGPRPPRGDFGKMIGGYSALAEKLIISSLCDLLRPHTLRRMSAGFNKHRVGIYTYHHPRNRRNKIEAERFFSDRNRPDLEQWCDMLNADVADVLKIVRYCVDHDKDRLFGKRIMRSYLKARQDQTDDEIFNITILPTEGPNND